ncbi:hypothetical protein F0234_02090 [Vibrio splendidus]|uniref:Uncharacterized protein n=1 Tax=Vibrio splendidus TaxID=29497 RepID=A0A7Y4D3R7_VIBSP|nr:hypothetical protein [Vibrio splendidus]
MRKEIKSRHGKIKADAGYEWRDAKRFKSGCGIRVARCEEKLRADAGYELRDAKRFKSGCGIRVTRCEEI